MSLYNEVVCPVCKSKIMITDISILNITMDRVTSSKDIDCNSCGQSLRVLSTLLTEVEIRAEEKPWRHMGHKTEEVRK